MFSRMYSYFYSPVSTTDLSLDQKSDELDEEIGMMPTLESESNAIDWSKRASSDVFLGLELILSREANYCSPNDAHSLRKMVELFEKELEQRREIQACLKNIIQLPLAIGIVMFVLLLTYFPVKVELARETLNHSDCEDDYAYFGVWFECKDSIQYDDADYSTKDCVEFCHREYNDFTLGLNNILSILGACLGTFVLMAIPIICAPSFCGTAFLGYSSSELREKMDIASAKAIEIEGALLRHLDSSLVNRTYQHNGMDIGAKRLICPITREIMLDPVINALGHTYERSAIEAWYRNNDTDPSTLEKMPNKVLVPNYALKGIISVNYEEQKPEEETKTSEQVVSPH